MTGIPKERLHDGLPNEGLESTWLSLVHKHNPEVSLSNFFLHACINFFFMHVLIL